MQSPIFSDTNTIAYLSSDEDKQETLSGRSQGSPQDSDKDFNISDDEPLLKYVSPTVNENDEEAGSTSSDSDTIIMSKHKMPVDPDSDAMNVEWPPKKHKVGRPKGRAKPLACDFTLQTSIQFKNIRRDHVDEECQRLGIYYRCWVPLNPQQISYPSVRDFSDDTVIPDEQNIPSWCILCPRNTYLKNYNLGHHHYLSRHHKTLLVMQDFKMFSCKCSEIRSHGSDNSTRNKHYHCHLCYHPFKTADHLSTHYISQHPKLDPACIKHLMKPSNPCRRRF